MPNFPRGRAFAGVFLMLCGVATSAGAATPKPAPPTQVPGADQVRSMTLANGMKIIVWTDRDIPNVALYNWVRVGSRNEVPGITGLAQVCGSRKLATPEVYALEIWAARHRTAALTLQIMAMTPLFVLGWRNIGRTLLDRARMNPEVMEIERACQQELLTS